MIDWESPMAKRWLIENEPVLLRDILPKVMNDIRRQQLTRANADGGAAGRTPATHTRPGRTLAKQKNYG